MAFDVYQHAKTINSLLREGMPFVIATLVEMRGSAPQVVGAKAVITAQGIADGTVGGGKVEARVIDHAQTILRATDGLSCELVTWNLQTEIGMTCGGEVKFLFERLLCNDWKIAVFGAGHIAQALVPLLLTMNCRVTCLDQRPEWLDRINDHPKLTKICASRLETQVPLLDPGAFFVLMTQGHATDLPVLAEVLRTIEPPYVGVLGSLQKAKVLRRDLRELKLSDAKIDAFYCPMGLPIGNNTPAEIAISVTSQLIQQRDKLGIIQQKTKVF